MLKKLQTVKQKVKQLLETKETLRDNDEKLLSTYWHQECVGMSNVRSMTGFDLLQKIAEGKLTTADTITRMRVLVQKENVHLRGVNYKTRKKIQETVRTTIHEV